MRDAVVHDDDDDASTAQTIRCEASIQYYSIACSIFGDGARPQDGRLGGEMDDYRGDRMEEMPDVDSSH